jgi:Uma2 family endonuclease
MSTADLPTSTPGQATPESTEDPFRLGWRYERQAQPDGSIKIVEVPLTPEGVLYPEEDDFLVTNPGHVQDCEYLHSALRRWTRSDPQVVVHADCRIDWDSKEVKPLGPDISVFTGVTGEWKLDAGTFHPRRVGGRPLLVIEVTSDSTWENDLGIKVELYFKAGVPWYYIADRYAGETRGQRRLLGYRAGSNGYEAVPTDELGRLWMEPLKLWLAWEGDRVVLLDERGNQVPDEQELVEIATHADQARAEAEKEKQEEARARQEAERARADTVQQLLESERGRADALQQLLESQRAVAEVERRLLESEQGRADVMEQFLESQRARADVMEQLLEAQRARVDAVRQRQEAEKREQEASKQVHDLAARLAELEAEKRRLRGQG